MAPHVCIPFTKKFYLNLKYKMLSSFYSLRNSIRSHFSLIATKNHLRNNSKKRPACLRNNHKQRERETHIFS